MLNNFNVIYAETVNNHRLGNSYKISSQTLDGNKNNSFLNTFTIEVDSTTDFKTKTRKSIASKPKEAPKQFFKKDIISGSKVVNSYVSKHNKLYQTVIDSYFDSKY